MNEKDSTYKQISTYATSCLNVIVKNSILDEQGFCINFFIDRLKNDKEGPSRAKAAYCLQLVLDT